MRIYRVSPLTGKQNYLDLDITGEQYDNWKNKAMLIQNAMPHLTSDEREFLISGLYPGEWDEYVGEESD